jgi:DUF1365 family protein
LIAARRLAAVSFLPTDHLHASTGPLEVSIRDLVERQTGARPAGAIRLLTQLRYFGYYFSPLNLYYCFDEAEQELQSIVAEVNNTPWREQHCYVLWEGNRRAPGAGLRFEHEKAFHVSPFMGMEFDYHWRLTEPGEKLGVAITNVESGGRYFDASMTLHRRPLDRRNLAVMMVRYPLMTLRIMSAIHIQALRLWWKKTPFHPHPKVARGHNQMGIP